MRDDDKPVGRLLTRREVIALLGSAAVFAFDAGMPKSAFAAARVPCIVRPEQTEGPYFVDKQLERSDIRCDPDTGVVCDGMPLALTIGIQRVTGKRCAPLPRAMVDIWHCDAAGVYSGVSDPDFDTSGKKFLRGFQRTDENGQVRFSTIYPGWYPGRTVHIHLKVRLSPAPPGKDLEFTSQMYFSDFISDVIFSTPPYRSRGTRKYRNHNDIIFRDAGPRLMATAARSLIGYRAAIDYALLA